jgi:NAD(P)-dependent dehydrogenase (short-subunit alcohol dehydrogenase family)
MLRVLFSIANLMVYTSSLMQKILELFSLHGQVALVSGGNRGLGLAMAKALAEAGAAICIAARDVSITDKAIDELRVNSTATAFGIACDVTNEESVREAVAGAVAEFGRIDILINSAGINIRGAIEDISLADFNFVQQVNVTGTWLMCREVIPHMKAKAYGRIINIGSMLSLISIAQRTPYASSKGAVLQLTKTLALEVARHGITVNAILPGPFATEMNTPLLNDPVKYQEFVSKIPVGRWGELYEVGALALYLASGASAFTTGSGISIDGGWTAQ